MVDTMQIKEHMPVVCSNGGQFATVDRVEGNSIKLTKDDQGRHHYIPASWVTRFDEHVHVDRPGEQAMQKWSTSPMAYDLGLARKRVGEPIGPPTLFRVSTTGHEVNIANSCQRIGTNPDSG